MRISCSFHRLFGAAVTGVLMAAALAACGSSSSSSPGLLSGTCLTNKAAPLALVVGSRSNTPNPKLPALLDPLLEDTANDQQQISLIRIDGQPKVFTPPPFSTTAQNSAARTQDLISYLNDSVGPILQSKIHAQVPQADVLTALDLAASATGMNGNIIIVDSGLQTVAPLDYQDPNLLLAPPGDVVTYLRQKGLLPNLTGRHVLLSGFGYTASPQPPLNQPQRTNVVAQWTAIIKAGGGCVTADPTPNTSAEIAGLPQVGIVTPPATPAFSNCGTIALADAGSVGFVVGTATFRDPPAAEATLQQLADTLKQGTEHIRLIGSTSSEGGDAVNNPLSLQRAQAVEKVLLSMDIPASRITTVGDGSHWSGRVNDIGSGGVLLPAQAEQDRAVIVQLPLCT
ncbi:MAG: OmpA family protein [Streptosporangiaceae bacterium]|jgi:outer membrane protein OmpA-like peptidoglycan-associated protein